MGNGVHPTAAPYPAWKRSGQGVDAVALSEVPGGHRGTVGHPSGWVTCSCCVGGRAAACWGITQMLAGGLCRGVSCSLDLDNFRG